ncbi:MAG TPA: hypothetical protein VL069_15210 [Opitutus sp.]|nr:hypothetical protein [Opitutus sp.]
MLDQLERRFGRYAPTHVTLFLIIGQVFVCLSYLLGLLDLRNFVLVPALVTHGEAWRLLTFLFYPPPVNFNSMFSLALLPFAWWIFYLMGNALESYWGAFRYTLFLFVGVVVTIAAAFLTPDYAATNWYFYGSVFLAFAWLNPDFELSLFFILPIKIKWLALFTLAGYVYQMVDGGPSTRWLITASLANILLFFGRDFVSAIRYRRRTMAVRTQRAVEEKQGPQARHQCRICGKTDLTNPEMDFRYCSKCAGDECYCPDHIANHEHVLEKGEEATA